MAFLERVAVTMIRSKIPGEYTLERVSHDTAIVQWVLDSESDGGGSWFVRPESFVIRFHPTT
jgi:hypothetical protein